MTDIQSIFGFSFIKISLLFVNFFILMEIVKYAKNFDATHFDNKVFIYQLIKVHSNIHSRKGNTESKILCSDKDKKKNNIFGIF